MDHEQYYYRVKFGLGILENTNFVEKLVKADNMHHAVTLVCGNWKWGHCVGPGISRLDKHTFSDGDGKWAQVQMVLAPWCYGCNNIMCLSKDSLWYCAYCDD